MQAKGETPKMEAILQVYRDLGLEDAKTRDQFKQLTKFGDLHTGKKTLRASRYPKQYR